MSGIGSGSINVILYFRYRDRILTLDLRWLSSVVVASFVSDRSVTIPRRRTAEAQKGG
jgi:hypothetical protein